MSSSLYCSQGHPNQTGSRFCSTCGESLTSAARPAANERARLLGDRYRIVRQLGTGGFGRTYLAEDLNRFNECCVLKEFAPQVQDTASLQKAESLFEREAGVLYQLRHPQIPRFRELLRTQFENHPRLFLVQDYVDGQTYEQLRESRRFLGGTFTEAEVVRLFQTLLPVLQYIHSRGVIHRDISPDNVILRSSDQLPVLIDFGGVKQIAASVASQFAPSDSPEASPSVPITRLGKAGYAPSEQLNNGQVYPHSDLYALAVTALVLLTGKEATELGNVSSGRWAQQVSISPGFQAILERMVSAQPQQRYSSADAVLQALDALNLGASPVPPPPSISPTQAKTQAVSPLAQSPMTQATQTVPRRPSPAPVSQTPQPSGISAGTIATIAAIAILTGGVISAGWFTRDWWIPLFTGAPPTDTDTPTPDTPFSPEEQARKEVLRNRRRELGVDMGFLVALTNDEFYRTYPEINGRNLTEDPSDAEWRQRWDTIALDWLNWFEQNLSGDARRQLGSYDAGDRANWKERVNRLRVSSRALNDLADARFFHAFPEWRDTNFIDLPVGQVWQAIAFDQMRALESGDRLDPITFSQGEFSQSQSGELDPGGGYVYTTNLREGQPIRLNLSAPGGSTLLSLYVPSPTDNLPFLLEDSRDTQWNGELPQSGYYEVVIVSTADAPIAYTVDLAADEVTTTPIEPDEETDKEDDRPVEPDQAD